MSKRKSKTASKPVGGEIIRGLRAFRDVLRDSGSVPERFTMRTVHLVMEPEDFGPKEIRSLRAQFGASQAVFAMLIGVRPSTVRSWEQGRSSPPAWGRRLLGLVRQYPDHFEELLEKGAAASKHRRAG